MYDTRSTSRRGNASVVALVSIVAFVGITGAILTSSLRLRSERGAVIDNHEAMIAADSGLAHVLANLAADDDSDVGGAGNPLRFGGGAYWADVEDNGDGTYTVTSTGVVSGQEVTVEAVLVSPAGVFDNALFAGNDSGDPGYILEFGGEDDQADEILGDVYSGAGVELAGDSTISGTIRATGTITGGGGESGISLPVPDLQAPDYANTADFDVAALFSSAEEKSDAAGGQAWQVPESNPAHIFRRNPDDRQSSNQSTVKDDYFLEDPYESVRVDYDQDGSDPYMISLSGVGGEPGPDGNRAVYYIDGNLWIHNKKTYSFAIESQDEGVQVAFVVKGNIYFSDNLFYEDPEDDGVLFIAMEDEQVADSGNIYFGDPEFGTLQQMYAFMYAENDFYDTNLDASGSTVVEVHGNMSAGNHVLIERDYGGEHTKLKVDFDDRISIGELEIPGLPTADAGTPTWTVASWRTVPTP